VNNQAGGAYLRVFSFGDDVGVRAAEGLIVTKFRSFVFDESVLLTLIYLN